MNIYTVVQDLVMDWVIIIMKNSYVDTVLKALQTYESRSYSLICEGQVLHK